MPTLTMITAIAGLVFGLVGAVLGVINLWRALDRDRIKLLVVPRPWADSTGQSGLCLDVINRGEYAVTISAVGILLRGDEKLEWQFVPIDEKRRCPYRLEPHDAVTFRAKPGAEQDKKLVECGRCAFARTACGHTAIGSSGYLRSVLRRK
ncbi:MAG: hypothetical protein HZA93_13175 [Verrucomicrobia bacterium]|nr:hypothetical protein [Verrucomicrobiota bacterium]